MASSGIRVMLVAVVMLVFHHVRAFQIGPLPETMFEMANTRSKASIGAKVRLNEHGYQKVLASKDDDAMKAFILRLLDDMDLAVQEGDLQKLDDFASFAASSGRFKSLPDLKSALALQTWIVQKIKEMAAKVVESVHGVADKFQKIMGKNEEKVVPHRPKANLPKKANATIHAAGKGAPKKVNAASHAKAPVHHTPPHPPQKHNVEHAKVSGTKGPVSASAKVAAPKAKPQIKPMSAETQQHTAPKPPQSVAEEQKEISHKVGELKKIAAQNNDKSKKTLPDPIRKVEASAQSIENRAKREAMTEDNVKDEPVKEEPSQMEVAKKEENKIDVRSVEPEAADKSLIAGQDADAPKQLQPVHKSTLPVHKSAPPVHKKVVDHAKAKAAHHTAPAQQHKVKPASHAQPQQAGHTSASHASNSSSDGKSERSGATASLPGNFFAFVMFSGSFLIQ
eukprot:TRINITY_DN37361_c0_g1_i1.p1 TRINITY_DN37361_c0_g1~~TRINITY_DN37361_c0_g1_i1.p1  ORF type:complete len:451 (+),score=98.79 TRINITY_DN37361_c0_g1_i1:175-1527(+)